MSKGGLLSFGAPWEVPAMYNIIEAFHQLTGKASGRQVQNTRRALVYGIYHYQQSSYAQILTLTFACYFVHIILCAITQVMEEYLVHQLWQFWEGENIKKIMTMH